MKKTVGIVLAVMVLVFACGACGMIGMVQDTQHNLLNLDQAVGRGQSQYAGALDIVSQKIAGVWTLASESGNIDSQAISDLATAYGNFITSEGAGTPLEQVSAALDFNVQAQSLTVAVPELQSAPVFQEAMGALEEAVNEIFTAFQDSQDAVQVYNSYRGQLFAPVMVGGLLGFQDEYPYYEGNIESLNMQQLMQTAPAQ